MSQFRSSHIASGHRASGVLVGVLALALPGGLVLGHDEAAQKSEVSAVTTEFVDIPTGELELLVKPLRVEELQVEADAWLALLRLKTIEVGQAEIAVKQKHKIIEQAEDVQEAIEDTQELLDDVRDASQAARDEGTVASAEAASELAEKAKQAAEDTADTIDEAIKTTREVAISAGGQQVLDQSATEDAAMLTASAHRAEEATAEVLRSADETAEAAQGGRGVEAARLAEETVSAIDDAQEALVDTSEAVNDAVEDVAANSGDSLAQLTKTADAVEAIAESQMEDKIEILDTVTELRAERTELIDRLNVVVDELSAKLGEGAEGAEHELVVPYRLYAASVGGLQVDVSDTQAAWSTLVGWLRSDVGGVRVARNLAIFCLSVVGFWLFGMLLGKLIDKLMLMGERTALLIREFIVHSVRRGAVVAGVVIGLIAIDVNIGPLLALIGAAGFVIAFALQNTLSNFASGMMIMLYRPFDVGDLIEVAGVTGVAQSMNLVTTTISTLDNQILIVPNNSIWGNTIINITGSETRRVDLIVGISYGDDIALAEQLMREILREHPLVLDEPKADIAVQELAEYSVNFVCRPWTRTENYWRVYWDITRSVKERFEQAGLETPYPHHNIHTRSGQPE